MNNYKLLKRIEYLKHILESTEEFAERLDDASVSDKDLKDFQALIQKVFVFTAKLDGLSNKEALNMFKADMEEIDEIVGGSHK